MAGLVGVISHHRGARVPEAELDGLLESFVAVRGGGAEQRFRAGDRAHIGLVDIGPESTTDTDGASWIAAVGAIHSDRRLLDTPVDGFDGQFAGVRHEAGAGTIEVFTDPFGMQALFRAGRGDRTYIATSALVLARYLDAEPDELGMSVFLRAGYQIGPITHWRGIERLDPAICLTFADGTPQSQVYWRPEVDERVHGMSLDETADHCVRLALDVAKRRLADAPRSWVDLTGGFDSRMVAGILAGAGINFVANTNGEEGDTDVRLARRVASAGGFEWHHIRPAHDWAIDAQSAQNAAAWADGALDVFHLARVLHQHQLKSELSRTVITGGGGEHFNSFPWQQEFLRAGRTSAVSYDALLTMRYLKHVNTRMMARDPEAQVRRYFRDQLGDRARTYAAAPNTTQLDAIYAYKSVGHFGAFRSAGEGIVRTEIPCYYRDIFQSAFSANHRWRTNHRLQRRMIARLGPAIAAVPTTHGGSAEPITARTIHQVLPYFPLVGKRGMRKLARRGKPALLAAQGLAAIERNRRANEALRRDGLLDAREMRSAALYDQRDLEAFLASSSRAEFADWPMLGRIATLECALRVAGRG